MNLVTDLPGKKEYFRLFESTGWNEDYELFEDEIYETLKKSWYQVFAYSDDQLISCA